MSAHAGVGIFVRDIRTPDQQLILAIYVRRTTAKIVSKVIQSFKIFCLKVKRILVIIKKISDSYLLKEIETFISIKALSNTRF